MVERAEAGPRRISVLASIQSALARPATWAALWAVELALASLPALAWFQWLRSTIDHHYAPDELFGDLGTVFRFDQRAGIGQLDAASGQIGALLAVLFMLLGAFAAGGWLTLFLSSAPERGLRPFLAGGARFFGRFARVWILSILLLALATWLLRGAPWNRIVLGGVFGVPATDFEKLETLSSERTVFLLRGAQALMHALLVALVLVWGDYTRTRLALFDTRSALWAGVESALFIVMHPLRALAPMLGIFLFEVAFLLALGVVSNSIEAGVSELHEVLVLFLLGQLALGWRIVLRGARYHAAVAVSRAHVRPIAKPDPWRFGRV